MTDEPQPMTASTSAPVELRLFCRRFTLEDMQGGAQPVRMPTGLVVNNQQETALFNPARLQYRYKERVYVDGKATYQWSTWFEVPIAMEIAAAGPEA